MANTKLPARLLDTSAVPDLNVSGRIGIGTTSPSSMNASANDLVIGSGTSSDNTGLTVFSNSNASGSIHFADGTSGADAYKGYIYYTHAQDFMGLGTAGTEKLRIESGGNIGIGTTNPDCLLHVESSDHTVARLKAGTDKQASLRLQNDAQQWGIQCQTSDHFQIENLTVSGIPFQMNPDGYLVLARNASEYGLQLRSSGTRSGLVIDKPGTSTIMGSLLVLSDESYRLGTASYYHVEMKQNGDTKINQNLLLTDSFGLRAYSGYFSAGTSTGTFIFNTYGSGVYEITAAFGHYGYIPSYGCFKKAICSNGQGYVNSNSISVTDIATEITTTNGGSWSFSGYDSSSVPSGSNTTGTVRVVKNAGTYGGGGYYFVEIRGNQSS